MKKPLTLLLVLICSSTFSFSQDNFRSTNTLEMGGELSFASQSNSNNDASQTTFKSSIYFGVMVAKGFELGFRPGFTSTSSSGFTLSTIDLYFNPNYNFATTSKVYPYLGFIIGYDKISGDSEGYSGMAIGGEGGLKFLISRNSLFLFKFEYVSQTFNNVETGFQPTSTEDLKINTISVGLGFRFFFPQITKTK